MNLTEIKLASLILLIWLLFVGVDGGFDNQEPEYDETYSIVILPDFISFPFPSVELPEKVIFSLLFHDLVNYQRLIFVFCTGKVGSRCNFNSRGC